MAEPTSPQARPHDPNSRTLHPLWMFITAISGIDDQAERVRLTATGLPSLLPCQCSGVALLDDGETPFHVIIQQNGQEVSLPQTEKLLADLLPLYQEALRYSKLLIITNKGGTENPEIPRSLQQMGIQSLVLAPLRTLRRQYGMVLVGRENHENFSRNEELIISTFTEHFAIGLENLHLYQSLQQHSQTLEQQVEDRTEKLRQAQERQRALLEINNAIIANLDRDSLLQAIAETLRALLPFDRATLTLLDPASDALKVHALANTTGGKRFLKPGMEFPRKGSALAVVYENKQPLIRHHLEKGPWLGIEQNLHKEGIRSYVAVPLMAKGQPFGTLNLGSQEPEAYSQGDVEFLTQVAQQVALAVENMMVYEEINELKSRLEQENLYLQEEITTEHGFSDIIGDCSALRQVLHQIEMVAPTDSSVLITGETGTGKEVIARAVHSRSGQKDKALVKVNCATIPAGLVESELFGHEKGAFTGALVRKIGRFELADGGTIFLDEIGELPLDLQPKLLRVLQEGEFERVGGTQTFHVNVRVIAATNRDPQEAMKAGLLRADLFYRLNVFPIHVPSLKERKEDIPLLVQYFTWKKGTRLGKKIETIPERVMQSLKEYAWPGNIRELEHVIERAVILSQGSQFELGDWFVKPSQGAGPTRIESLEDVERQHILSTLEATGWIVSGENGAAQILGLKRTTLDARMKKLGISRTP